MSDHAAAPYPLEEFRREERAMSVELEALLKNVIVLLLMRRVPREEP